MKKDEKIKLGYTTILHDPRIRFNMTTNEYCVADAIYHLSHNPNGAIFGWCYAKRETIGNYFGLSRQSIQSILKKLTEKKLIEIHEETRHIRTTSTWYENFVLHELNTKKSKV